LVTSKIEYLVVVFDDFIIRYYFNILLCSYCRPRKILQILWVLIVLIWVLLICVLGWHLICNSTLVPKCVWLLYLLHRLLLLLLV